MSSLKARCDTEGEIHTIGALLCILDEVAVEHLSQHDDDLTSGIINLIQVVRDRVKKAQELHGAEFGAQSAEEAEESPIAALHREIERRNAVMAGDHGMSEEDFETYNMGTIGLADQVLDLPARDASDMLHKIMAYTCNGDHELGDCPRGAEIWAEAKALIGGQA